MKYICSVCEYKTTDRSNYNKHVKSANHLRNIVGKNENEVIDRKCDKCDQHIKPGSTAHKNGQCLFNTKSIEDENYELKKQLYQKIKQLEKMNNTNNQPVNNTYNISVKNYIQQNYSKAPPLKRLNNKTIMQIIDEDIDNNYEEEKNDDDDLMDKLIHNYKHNILHVYLGNLLIKYYKKEDPTEQSIWNSDPARLTYIVKELLANNNSCWTQDHKGNKVKNYIINPMLQYIKKYIDECVIVQINEIKNTLNDGKNILDILKLFAEIKSDIDNHILSNKIVRYIATHFKLDNNNIKLIDN